MAGRAPRLQASEPTLPQRPGAGEGWREEASVQEQPWARRGGRTDAYRQNPHTSPSNCDKNEDVCKPACQRYSVGSPCSPWPCALVFGPESVHHAQLLGYELERCHEVTTAVGSETACAVARVRPFCRCGGLALLCEAYLPVKASSSVTGLVVKLLPHPGSTGAPRAARLPGCPKAT